MEVIDLALDKLRGQFGEDVLAVKTFRDETTVKLAPKAITAAVKLLREDPDLKFNMLMLLTAVDYFPQEPRFIIAYRLYSMANDAYIGINVPVPGDKPQLPTIESVFPNANWHEREVFDMFGVEFSGHSDPRRILMPHDWEGHPLRKDYPLGYEEVQFTFNFDDIDRNKPYAKE
jgi:NADH-quinone oxidoreductase subunit C